MRQAILPMAVLLAGVAHPALAQDANGGESSVGYQEIIVTAQKREESLQDVAISMEVLQGETLENFGTVTVRDLTTLVPNFHFQPSPGNDALFMRGFGSSGANFGFDQSVSLYEDGIYAGRARQFMAPFFDVDRVEVLRGPQGALLGKNTAAGAVSIVTANPTDTLEVAGTGLYNFTRDGFEVSGHIAGPVSDTLGVRLAVKHVDMGGYVDNITTGGEEPDLNNTLARLTLRFEPSDKFDLTGKVEFARFRTIGDSGRSAAPGAPIPDVKTDQNIYGFPLLDRQKSYNNSLNANFYLGDHVLTSVTGYTEFHSYRAVDAASEANAIFHNQYFEDFHQFSQELRLTSPTGQFLEYIVGAYYDDSYDKQISPTYFTVPLFGVAGETEIDFRQKAKTKSAFVSATANLLDSLRLKGQLRYTKSDKFATFDEVLVSGTVHPAIGGARYIEAPINESYWDPSATVEFDVAPDVMLFATYGRGSKGGGYASAVRTATLPTFTVRGERSTNYEIGFRSMFLDRVVTLNVTAFNTKFRDLQVSAYVPALATTITTNAASARSRGVEGNLIIAPSRSLTISSAFAYLDAKYLDYPGAPCTALQPATCLPSTNNQAGYRLLNAPKWSGNVRVQYSTPVSDTLKLETSAVTTFSSKSFIATDYNPAYGIQTAYAKIDARIQIGATDDAWSLALIVKNLTNKDTYPFRYAFPGVFASNGNRIVTYIDEPRTFSVSASFKF